MANRRKILWTASGDYNDNGIPSILETTNMNNGDVAVDYCASKELIVVKNTLGNIVNLSCGFTKTELEEKFNDIYERLNTLFEKFDLMGYNYYLTAYDLTNTSYSFHSQEDVCLFGGYKVSKYEQEVSELTEKDFTYILKMSDSINNTSDFKYAYSTQTKPSYITDSNTDENYYYYYFTLPTMIYADTQEKHYSNGDKIGALSLNTTITETKDTLSSTINLVANNIIDLGTTINSDTFGDNATHYDIVLKVKTDGSIYNENGSCIIASGENPLGDASDYTNGFQVFLTKDNVLTFQPNNDETVSVGNTFEIEIQIYKNNVYIVINNSKICITTFEDNSNWSISKLSYALPNGISVDYANNNELQYDNFVDLGLPSGILWAKTNLGANNEYDYGLYFQWGSTVGYEGEEAKAHSTVSTSPPNGGNVSIDRNIITTWVNEHTTNSLLNSDVDAATVMLGNNWKTPSNIQWQELIDNTTRKWVSNNGINGYNFTSKTDTSKSIFIPAAGSVSYEKFSGINSLGSYLTNTVTSNIANIYRLTFNQSNCQIGSLNLFYAMPIRPVFTY